MDVSVVIAVKNEEVHVESAVTSVVEQVGLTFEVIVVDDGSTDRTSEILSALAGRHAHLRVVRNPKAGKCSAFNHGISLATGRFVCIFAGDDIMPAGSLAARFAKVKDYPVDEPVVGLCKLVTMSEVKRFDGHLVPRKPGVGALSGVSPLMSQQVLHKIFPVPEMLPNEDTWMELAVLHYPGWTVVHSDIVGCAWRVHQGNSINMMSAFPEYNRKITIRLRAYGLFLAQHGADLRPAGRSELQAKVQCEEQRVKGSVIGVLRSPVGWVDRLRALSITNGFMYGVRRRLYGLLSGW
ncbi:glycosyltransferase involved in cell wall biosynthesis [Pelomonas saccharophila]|uniref:Glycosyltransferase involved in cell wall biosynthesis n=1 Tax=Roseateles saccharophilus TaxID=304 RepID=A0ABU1YSK8_ROSSA|nr:glycosyltransferase family 2 protein [Roseateles saccharophilus]MDR7271844.1 glycosyltransferase involved in cell wall biosynthesis [Roseateles saccharophilus]